MDIKTYTRQKENIYENTFNISNFNNYPPNFSS